jgi:hypothetical protein
VRPANDDGAGRAGRRTSLAPPVFTGQAMDHANTSFALGAALALSAAGCSGVDAGATYPGDLPADLSAELRTPEDGPDPALRLGQFKIAPDVCKGIDTQPVTQPLRADDLSRFLEAQGAKLDIKKAREDLYWFDFPGGQGSSRGFLRLRVAERDDSAGAATDLHASLLEHGSGFWGVRRSNLAVLAPRASLREALGFALRYKLVCWGIFTVAGSDEAYVVAGPYSEL